MAATSGLGASSMRLEQRVRWRRARQRLLAGLQRPEDVDVGAGDERRTGADEDDGVGVGIANGAGHGVVDAFRDTRTERVDGRVVDGQDGDAIDDVVVNEPRHGPQQYHAGRGLPVPSEGFMVEAAAHERLLHITHESGNAV